MKQMRIAKRLAAAALALVLLLGLAACGGTAQDAKEGEGSADTLKGIFEALIAPDSDYSRNKELYKEYYPEIEYSEELGADRITLAIKANGNEYLSDGSWTFIKDGDRLSAEIEDGDYTGIIQVLNMAGAIGSYFGMEPELINGYINGLSMLDIESENFSVTEDAATGKSIYSLNIAGPWDMKELDQMVMDETTMGGEPLDGSFLSQSGNIGKIRMMANGNVDSYTMLFAEYGELDDIAFRSITNMVSLRRPAGWEQFLAEFTELKEIEQDAYSLDLDPDDGTIAELMGERNEKFRYALLRFGTESGGEQDLEIYIPGAEDLAEYYLRPVTELEQGTAGSSLAMAQAAWGALGYAYGNELWLVDAETLKANLQEGWESLSDEERGRFSEVFPALAELLDSCFADFEAQRGRFEDAGVAENMDALLEDAASQWSWEALRDATLALDGLS